MARNDEDRDDRPRRRVRDDDGEPPPPEIVRGQVIPKSTSKLVGWFLAGVGFLLLGGFTLFDRFAFSAGKAFFPSG